MTLQLRYRARRWEQGEWKQMDKNQREIMRQQEDKALNRGLVWVGAAIVLEFVLLLVNRYYLNFRGGGFEAQLAGTLFTAMRYLRIIGGAAALACLVWMTLSMKKGERKVLPVALFSGFGVAALASFVVLKYGAQGMQMLLLLVPALAGLALVFYLYQREFFLAAMVGGMGALGLWFVRCGGKAEALAVVAAILVVTGLTLWLMKQGGVVKLGETDTRVLPKKAGYPVILASCLAALAAIGGALVMGAAVAYYLIFAMMAWLFALLVYYTVKMM